MEIKQFNNAQTLYSKIVALDAEIITLDKRAIDLANREQTAKLSLQFEAVESTIGGLDLAKQLAISIKEQTGFDV